MPVVQTNGRAGGRSVYGHEITKFSRMGSLSHFFIHGATLRASRESSAINPIKSAQYDGEIAESLLLDV